MNHAPLLKRIHPKNLLSFGPDFPGLDLGPLNVLIGPNGCGKSNLIEAISLMRAAPKDFSEVTRKGGGITEWIWKGHIKDPKPSVNLVVSKSPRQPHPLRHYVSLASEIQRFQIFQENIYFDTPNPSDSDAIYRYMSGQAGPYILKRDLDSEKTEKRFLPAVGQNFSTSVIAQRNDPEIYPELHWLKYQYGQIKIYREWNFGRNSSLRQPQPADLANTPLEEDFSNLGLFLSEMKSRFPAAKRKLLEHLQKLYSGITDFEVSVKGGTAQVFLHEGDHSIPATRLSDGTLRYLCLLAILCDPDPPGLVCIEEPELGLHPDILPSLADLLKDASERTQLIVTTHSDILVDAMSNQPEAVVVCEKQDGQTFMERLDPEEMKVWLEKYRLGELWIKGQIGGTRW